MHLILYTADQTNKLSIFIEKTLKFNYPGKLIK